MRSRQGLIAAGTAGLEAVTSAGYEALLVVEDGTSIGTAGFPAAAAV